METLRTDGRACDMLRPIIFERAVNRYAEGSALIRWGNTHVLCTASVDDKVPPFLRGSDSGWITAEYAMLPRSTQSRMQREISRGKRDARGSEIQRLIGLQADGGTRTASISAGFVALFDALRRMCADGKISEIPLKNQIAAVSVGKCRGVPLLDLCYEEDSTAEVDANVVMTGRGELVELQGTGEGATFSRAELAQERAHVVLRKRKLAQG